MAQKINFISEGSVVIEAVVNDSFQVMSAYGLTLTTIINLCGGIPSEAVTALEIEVTGKAAGVFGIQIITNLYQTNRVIDFESGIINNSFMYVFERGNGMGTRLFCNQVREARLLGFRVIYTHAAGPEVGTNWGGYYCWGRLGYEMNGDDHENLLQLLKEFGRPLSDLHTLLATEDGRSFWMTYGFSWSGEFHLDGKSQNLTYLKQYLIENGKDFEI